MHPLFPLLLATLLGLSYGCSQPNTLNIYNGFDTSIAIEGLPNGMVSIEAGQFARFEGVEGGLELTAKKPSGQLLEEVKIAAPGPGGERLWNSGKGTCFVFGDFGAYYSAMSNQAATVRVLEIINQDQATWVSKQPVAAGPGQRLPAQRKGATVAGLVHLPCQAIGSENLARSWLEMRLPDLQPQ